MLHPNCDWNRLKLNQEISIAANRIEVRSQNGAKNGKAMYLVLSAKAHDLLSMNLD